MPGDRDRKEENKIKTKKTEKVDSMAKYCILTGWQINPKNNLYYYEQLKRKSQHVFLLSRLRKQDNEAMVFGQTSCWRSVLHHMPDSAETYGMD